MTGPDADPADALVARAIESVLEAVPTVPADEAATDLTKYQPWADTAAPTGKNKRPLAALLEELRERVEAEPDAVAARPAGRPPALAYFDRFGSPRRDGGGGAASGKRRRRGRGGPAGASEQGTPRAAAPEGGGSTPAQGRGGADPGGRRRRRRRGGRGRSGGGSAEGSGG